MNVGSSSIKNKIRVVNSSNDEAWMLNVRVHSMGYLEKLRSIFDQCTKFYLSMNAQIKFEISKGLMPSPSASSKQLGILKWANLCREI